MSDEQCSEAYCDRWTDPGKAYCDMHQRSNTLGPIIKEQPTMRDQFAMAVVGTIIAVREGRPGSRTRSMEDNMPAEIANHSYRIADAMLREKGTDAQP